MSELTGEETGAISVTCTYCGTLFQRYASATRNKKGEVRKIFKCPNCRKVKPDIRFWLKVDKTSSANGCWIWNGCINDDGYGCFPLPSGEQIAHRVAWILSGNTIPKGKYVLHKCPGKHNRACVNPSHLYIGDQSDNMRDSVSQGTHLFSKRVGAKHYHALLTDEAVREIRREYRRFNVKPLAEKFKVSIAAIRDVAKRRSWKHVV